MERKRNVLTTAFALALAILLSGLSAGFATAQEEFDELTTAAANAVKSLFPASTVMGVGRETERGVRYFEVVLRDGDRRVEMEVAPDGSIGEIESVVALADVPQAALDEIEFSTRGARVRSVERHVVRGVPEGGTFAPVDPPVVLYEVEYEDNGRWREITVTAAGRRSPFEDDDDADDGDDGDDD